METVETEKSLNLTVGEQILGKKPLEKKKKPLKYKLSIFSPLITQIVLEKKIKGRVQE